MDELEVYLINEGYIDTQEPFSREEIQIRIQAYISNLEISREEAEIFLGRLFN